MITLIQEKLNNLLTNELKKYPTPTAGLALGLSSIGVNWDLFFPQWGMVIQLACAIIASLLLLPILVKYIIHFDLLINDMRHHILSGIVPTIAMAMMVISHSLAKISVPAQITLWSIAVVLHLILLTKFIIFRLQAFEFHHIVPTWFVPPIGIVVACVTVPNSALLIEIAQVLSIYGLLAYLIILPIMMYRLILKDRLEIAAQPSIAILAAPASLCLAGYINVMPHPNIILCLMLLGIALLMTTMVYVKLFYLLRLTFSPAFSAYTFPLAISVTAIYKSYLLINLLGLDQTSSHILSAIAHVELITASTVIFYILWKYVKSFLLSRNKTV